MKVAPRRMRAALPRPRGQTALFGPYQWIYNPRGLTAATREQIQALAAQGESSIRVFQWPGGEVIFENGRWNR